MNAKLSHNPHQRSKQSSLHSPTDVSKVMRSSTDMMPTTYQRHLNSPRSGRVRNDLNRSRDSADDLVMGLSGNNRRSGNGNKSTHNNNHTEKSSVNVLSSEASHGNGGRDIMVQHTDPTLQVLNRRDRKPINSGEKTSTPTRTTSSGRNALSRIATLRGGLPAHKHVTNTLGKEANDNDKCIGHPKGDINRPFPNKGNMVPNNTVINEHSESFTRDPLSDTKTFNKEDIALSSPRPTNLGNNNNKRRHPSYEADRFNHAQNIKRNSDVIECVTSSPQKSPHEKITSSLSRELGNHFEDLPAAVATREKIGVKNDFLVPEILDGNNNDQTSEKQPTDTQDDLRNSPTKRKPKMLLRGEGQKRIEQAHRQNRGVDTILYEPQKSTIGLGGKHAKDHKDVVSHMLPDKSAIIISGAHHTTMADEEAEWKSLKSNMHNNVTTGDDGVCGSAKSTAVKRPLAVKQGCNPTLEVPESFTPVPKEFLDLFCNNNSANNSSSTPAMAIRTHLLSVFTDPRDVAYLSTFNDTRNKDKFEETSSLIEKARREDKQILEILDSRRLDFMNSVFFTPNTYGEANTNNGLLTTGQKLEKSIAHFPNASCFMNHESVLQVSRFEHIREILNSEPQTK